jgi:hypothetical protein
MSTTPVRDRSGLIDGLRSLDLVAPEEIQQLVLIVVARSFRIRAEELASEVVRLFGFARVTAEMRARIDAETSILLTDRRLQMEGDRIRLVAAQGEGKP